MIDMGFVFNGKFKRVQHGKRKCIAYYVAMDCGHASYRTMHSMKKSKTRVCGDCTRGVNYESLKDAKHNYHKKRCDFYESLLIEGAKVLDVISERDNNGKLLYFVEFICACGEITRRRPADITRYYKPKQKNKPKVACKSCGIYIGHNYEDYAPIKTMIKRLEREINHVTEKQDANTKK